MKPTFRIAWIGTGVMGQSMCSHLLKAGYPVTVYTRTPEKAKKLLESGAKWADSPAAAAKNADVLFSMVGFPSDVKQVLMGENGAIANMDPQGDKVVVDMTTSSPDLAEQMAQWGLKYNVGVLDAPVSGGDIGARNATLSIMIGGNRDTFEMIEPLLKLMGKTIVWQGESGSGQHAKMVNQILIAGSMLGLCEAMVYAQKSGLNVESVLQSVSTGAAGSWSLNNLAPRILADDFSPGFFIDHFIKDLGIVLEEAKQMHITLPGVELAHKLYLTAQEKGLGKDGTQALVKVLE